jgi:hypothetical protein
MKRRQFLKGIAAAAALGAVPVAYTLAPQESWQAELRRHEGVHRRLRELREAHPRPHSLLNIAADLPINLAADLPINLAVFGLDKNCSNYIGDL